jgi:hypothetical protein
MNKNADGEGSQLRKAKIRQKNPQETEIAF